MSAIPEVRRRRTALMVIGSVAVVAVIGVLLYVGGKALARYEGAKDASTDAEPIPVTPVGMLASVDELDQLTTVTIFVNRPAGEPGGSIIAVPVSADVMGGIDGQRVPLTETYTAGGAAGLVQAVESLLSLTIDQSLVATEAQLGALLQPVAPVVVNFPSDVLDGSGDEPDVVYEAGEASLSGGQLASVLTATVEGAPEAERWGNVEAVWQGVDAAIGDGRTPAVATPPTTLDQIVNQVFAGSAGSRGLVVTDLPADEVPEGKDVAQLDRADAVFVLATVAPSNMSAVATGLVYRVEAPPGYEDKVKWVISALLYLNANVQWVKLDGPVQDATLVYLADSNLADDALGAELLFGDDVEQADSDFRIEGIDVIIQLGTSFLDDPESGNTLPSTTTTTTTP
ncbi:MAG: hypothetical protein RL238_295 [Actinomycetota bacterium]